MSNQLATDYQSFIHKSRYAKYFDGKGRESYGETVARYIDNVVRPAVTVEDSTIKDIEQAILNQDIMPSMRAMMTAGPALDRDNTAGYNCSYLPVDDPKSFDEAMYILLCGTGVGFSVERQFVSKLPEVPELFESESIVVVKDSKEGWAKGFRQVLALLWAGEIPKWDVSQVRPAGARLKTFGGRASGPAPLVELFNFAVSTFKSAQGRRLSSMECHDLMCFIGQIVVVGGVRRSAMISLSNLSDDRMRHAKSGQWWETAGHRALANNSVSYTEKPDMETFMREWLSLVESKSGERGIFNREASKKQAAKFGRRDPNYEFGTNPCSEIILRPYQFCNLTECVVRANDTLKDLERKVKLATILGTIQSTMIKFPYLRKVWQKNTAEERLLGVSMTGIMDNPLMTSANKGLDKTLEHLRSIAVATNAEWAERLGIPASASISSAPIIFVLSVVITKIL
jgi:ribonucleoside-diphosphate reductase alpha chain